jgi:hypothetical protein
MKVTFGMNVKELDEEVARRKSGIKPVNSRMDPDNFWIDDVTGERVNALTGERSKAST